MKTSINHIFLQYFFVLVFTGGSTFLSAQKILTLEEAIATTLQNNYDIRLAKNDSMIAAIDYSYRNAVFLPFLNANTATVWNNNRQKQTLADGTERSSKIRSNNLQGNVALNWVLFDGFKMFATRDKAEALLQAGTYTAKEQIINTIANVVNTYYGIARQEQLVKATDVQIGLNEERAKLAQNKLDIGTGAKPDVLQSKVDLNEQQALRLQQQNYILQLKEQLIQAMNSNIKPDEFQIPDTIPINTNIALGDLQDGLEQSNPALLLAKSRIDIAGYSLKESRAERFPTLAFNSAYNFNQNRNQIAINPFSTLFNQTYGYNYGFALNIPIFNQFRVKKQIKQDELNVSFQKMNYENQYSLVNLNILNAFSNYQQQQKALKLEEENIRLARENVDIIWQTYRLGMATLIQLREAQLSMARAYDRLIAARYSIKVSETELLRLKGTILR